MGCHSPTPRAMSSKRKSISQIRSGVVPHVTLNRAASQCPLCVSCVDFFRVGATSVDAPNATEKQHSFVWACLCSVKHRSVTMHEIQNPTASPSGYPGTEASSSDLDRRCGRKTFGRSERRSRSSSRSAIWRYSIWPLIASYAAATLSRSEWMTLP